MLRKYVTAIVLKRAAKYITGAVIILHLFLALIIFVSALWLRNNDPAYTSLMLYRMYFYNYKVEPVKYIPLKEIPEYLAKMVIATEDYRFYSHPGIDIEAVMRAYVINRKVGYRMYGGSTITQQLARTFFLIPKKLLLRKYIEALIAVEMELFLSKDRILELYLNYCELGKGIFGIGSAAEYYYQKEVPHLSLDETTRLITILASPISYGPYSFEKRKFLSYRYYFIKFRYYSYRKFNEFKKISGKEALN